LSIASTLRERRTPIAIGGLGLFLGVSLILQWWLTPPPVPRDFVGPPRSGYTLRDFTLDSYGDDGTLAFHMVAPHLERREDDESLYINAPKFLLPSATPGVPDWNGNSEYAWVNAEGTLLKLQGKVYMHRPGFTDQNKTLQDPIDMWTSEVTAWPKENRMITAEPVRMVQGPTTMNGIGMRANLDTKHLELLNEFHGIYPPRQRKS
jgi:lipopolysaccharide export system protein LptC